MYQSKSITNSLELVTELGFPLPSKLNVAAKNIEFPNNLGELDDLDLSEQLTCWTELKTQAAYYEAIMLTNKVGLELALKEHESEKFIQFAEELGESKSNFIKAKIATDPRTKELKIKLQQRSADYALICAVKYGYEEKYTAVSRELSRRGLCK